MGALYQISFPNGKGYIGMAAVNVRKRFWEHRYHAKRGTRLPLYDAMRKHGAENVNWDVLVTSNDRVYLEMLERKAIIAYGTRAPNGYNMTDGGDGAPLGNKFNVGKIRTKESRAKMSASRRGMVMSPETRAKIGTASLGNKYSLGRVQSLDERKRRALAQTGKFKGGSSGVVGVSWHPVARKWRAHITVYHKFIHLGFFEEKKLASEARSKAEAAVRTGASA